MPETLTEVLAAHRPYGLDCKCGAPINSDGWWIAHVLEAVAAAGLAVVELPDPDYDNHWDVPSCGEYRGMESCGDSVISVELVQDGIEVETCGELTPQESRLLAAALLAAAGHAESAEVYRDEL